MKAKFEYATGAERRKVKLCPCGESNNNMKFASFKGHENYGYCHSCDNTFFPPSEGNESPTNVSVSLIRKVLGNRKPETLHPITIIPDNLIKENVISADSASLIKWLLDEKRRGNDEKPFTLKQVQAIVSRYKIRGTKKYEGGIAFIYIDIREKVRQIKLMAYSPTTGKRLREPGKIMQIGKDLAEQAMIENINIVACFFGEHLLKDNNKDVYIFESEATAIYASVFYSDCICLATGGKNGCKWDKPEQFKILIGRRVMLWPDIDAHEEWTNKAVALKNAGIAVYVNQTIVHAAKRQAEKSGISYEKFRIQKYDLRDILIFKNSENQPKVKEPVIEKPPLSEHLQNKVEIFKDLVPESGQPIPDPDKFSTTDFKSWFETIDLPTIPMQLNTELTVYNLKAFVNGRLNHINAFTNYKDGGNRSLFIHHLQQIRDKLMNE